MAEVIWSKESRDDLEEIYLQMLDTSSYFADVWVDDVIKMTVRLETFPELGRVVPELKIKRIRECIVRQYRLIYEVRDKGLVVEIMAIRHSSRPLSDF